MAVVLRNLYQGYFWIFDELSDSRTDESIFCSPFLIAGIMAFYVYTVKVWGPRLMEDRKPFDIKKLIMFYDAVQIALNVYITIIAFLQISIIPVECDIDWSNSSRALTDLYVIKSYFYLKLFDLVETVFFVMRKSYRQISFLHVYHHAGMILCTFIGFRFFGGGLSLWIPFLNGIVHAVMFIYYLLTAIDSSWKQSIILKKSLTQIQLIQFGIFIMVFGSVFFRDCQYPKFASYVFVPQNVFMILLFGDFYLKTYVFKKSKDVKK